MKTAAYARLRLFIACIVLISTILLSACKEDTLPEGAVATVNGVPIMLRQVEAEHDVTTMSWFSSRAPSVEYLKAQYGDALFHIIVQELLSQSLERADQSVTDAEVAEREKLIRADYPDDEFEKALIEDYLDLEVWRTMLRYTLTQDKFQRTLLRPSISITAEEVRAHYDENMASFAIPARAHFIVISSSEKALVEEARQSLLQQATTSQISLPSSPARFVQELRLEPERMPQAWATALEKLEPGQLSPVLEVENDYQCLMLIENMAAAQLGLARAYPLIERILIEEKLGAAFVTWLEKEMNAADIKVSPHLIMVPEERARLTEQEEEQPASAEIETIPDFAPPDVKDDEGI